MPYMEHSSKAILKVEISSAFVAVPGIVEFTPPEMMQIMADMTEIQDDDSRQGPIGRRESQPGKITVKFDPQDAKHVALLDANDADEIADCDLNFEIHYPDTTGLIESFTAFPKLNQRNLDKKGPYQKEFSLVLKTKITRTIS